MIEELLAISRRIEGWSARRRRRIEIQRVPWPDDPLVNRRTEAGRWLRRQAIFWLAVLMILLLPVCAIALLD